MLLAAAVLLLQAAQPPARRPAVRPTSRPAVTQVPQPPGVPVLSVRGPRGPVRTALLFTARDAGGAREFVRADQLAAALGGTLADDGVGRWRVVLGELRLGLREGVPFVVAERGGEVQELPLVDGPIVEGERLWLPIQLASELLPRLVLGARFDAERRQLVVEPAGAVAARPAPAAVPPAEESVASVRLPTIIGPRRPAPAAASSADPTGVVASPGAGGTLARRIVVVDAGHGGPDAGMRGPLRGGPAVLEKDVTLAVSLALREALRERGVGVVMTRTRDTLIALADRGRIANQQKGDLFVSIHVNAANPAWRDPAGARGFETYFLSEAKTEDDRRVAELENESVRFEGGEAGGGAHDPLGFLLRDMAQNEHLRESNRLATLVQRRLGRVHPGPSRGVKQAGFRVLVSAFMPAVLVEVGFGSNAAESAWLASDAGQRAIADAIADAAVEYLRRYQERVQGSAAP